MKRILLLTIISFLTFNSFSQKSIDTFQNNGGKILQIRYNNGGNESGYDELIITKDSISYEIVSNKISYYNKTSNTTFDWINLIKVIDLNKFDLIKGGQSERELDGLDTYIEIETSRKNHRLIVDNKNAKEIKTLLQKLTINLQKVYKKGKLEY